MKKFKFSKDEVLAIYKIADMMTKADGIVLQEEVDCIVSELDFLGYSALIDANLDNENALKALNCIADFDHESKIYVNAFLGNIIAIDGDIDDSELALWRLIGDLCNLPRMSVRQAVSLIAEYHQ